MPGTGSLIRKAELWRKKIGVEQPSGTAGSAGSFFDENWELNNFNKWTETSGTIEIVSAPNWGGENDGDYSCKADLTTPEWARKAITSQSPFWCTWWWGITDVDLGDAYLTADIMEFYGNSENDYIYIIIQNNAGGTGIGAAGFGYNTSSFTDWDVFTPTANTWYQFKFQVVAGSESNGIIRLWYRTIGGSWTLLAESTTTDFNVAFTGITDIRVGRVAGNANNATPDVYWDNIYFYTSDPG